jgi:hypothetical protein
MGGFHSCMTGAEAQALEVNRPKQTGPIKPWWNGKKKGVGKWDNPGKCVREKGGKRIHPWFCPSIYPDFDV